MDLDLGTEVDRGLCGQLRSWATALKGSLKKGSEGRCDDPYVQVQE